MSPGVEVKLVEKINHPSLRRFLEHWLEIRGDRLVPLRSQLDPVVIGPDLKFVWLYDYLPAEDSYRCRLAGEHIQDTHKRRLADLLIDEIYAPDVAAFVKGYWDTVRDKPAVIYGTAKRDADQSALQSERLMLPLCDLEGEVRQIFGMSIYDFDKEVDDHIHRIDDHDLKVFDVRDLVG